MAAAAILFNQDGGGRRLEFVEIWPFEIFPRWRGRHLGFV